MHAWRSIRIAPSCLIAAPWRGDATIRGNRVALGTYRRHMRSGRMGVQCSKRGVLLLGTREEFRAKALACAENAERATDPVERLRFLEMAEAWINLAERVGAHGDGARKPRDGAPSRDSNKP
jgi:hypothetical protein